MARHNKEQEDKSKVKLYKTKHGWFSALTRFFKIFAFRSKKEVKPTNFNDLDSLKDNQSDPADAYKKGAATIATLFGVGAAGAVSPTEAHAATTTVDQKSQVIGSGSVSTSASGSTSTSQVTISTSGSTISTSTSTSTSDVKSTSSSTSTSNSTTTSTSGSTSQSTASASESALSQSNNTSMASGTTANGASTSTATSTINNTNASQNTSSSVAASTTILNNDTLNDSLGTTTSSVTNPNADYINANTKVNATNLTNAAILTNLKANFVQANVENTAEVSNGTDFKNALNNSDISVIQLTADIDLGQSGMGDLQIPPRDLTIDGAGHSLNLGNNCIWLNNTTAGTKKIGRAHV